MRCALEVRWIQLIFGCGAKERYLRLVRLRRGFACHAHDFEITPRPHRSVIPSVARDLSHGPGSHQRACMIIAQVARSLSSSRTGIVYAVRDDTRHDLFWS